MILLLIVGVITVSFGYRKILFMGVNSVNADAQEYTTNKCLAFYPSGTKKGKEVARNLCKDVEEKTVFDYSEKAMGDYTVYSYENGVTFVADREGNEPRVSSVSEKGQIVISDYLRYTMKKSELDYAYTSKFLEETYYPEITEDRYTYRFDGDNFIVTFPEYDIDVNIPISVIGVELGMNVGEVEKYVKPRYVSKDRPAIALTFDDGPNKAEDATPKLIAELYKYDSVGTFFVVGANLGPTTKVIIQDGIEKGNEYGSHTVSHPNLTRLDSSTIYSEVTDIGVWFKDELDYDMFIYRPPEGAYNSTVDEAVPWPAILWDLDTEDWKYRDPEIVNQTIRDEVFDHCVVLMHDLHPTTTQAMVDYGMIKELIDDGYQLVTASELAELRGVELKQGTHLCWGD